MNNKIFSEKLENRTRMFALRIMTLSALLPNFNWYNAEISNLDINPALAGKK